MTKRILFLFNHDAAHQAAHIAGIAGELALHAPTVQVVVACGVEAIRHKVAEIIPAAAHDRIEWRMLDLPAAEQRLLAPINKVAPVLRVARLYRHLDLFRSVHLVVSTERTCLRVRRRLGAAGPRFAYVPHGSGDRNVSAASSAIPNSTRSIRRCAGASSTTIVRSFSIIRTSIRTCRPGTAWARR